MMVVLIVAMITTVVPMETVNDNLISSNGISLSSIKTFLHSLISSIYTIVGRESYSSPLVQAYLDRTGTGTGGTGGDLGWGSEKPCCVICILKLYQRGGGWDINNYKIWSTLNRDLEIYISAIEFCDDVIQCWEDDSNRYPVLMLSKRKGWRRRNGSKSSYFNADWLWLQAKLMVLSY